MLLEVDFDGAKYLWTGAAWVDQRFIRVPTLLANRLTTSVASEGLLLPEAKSDEGHSRHTRGSDRRGALDYELSRDNHLLISVNPSKAWRKYPHDWGAITRGRLRMVGVKDMWIQFEAFSAQQEPHSFAPDSMVIVGGVFVSFAG